MLDARRQHVQRHLLHDKPAVATLVIDVVWIPLAEVVIGPLVDRMIKIVGPRVERKLVQQLGIEMSFSQQGRIRAPKDFKRSGNEPFVAAGALSHVANVQRDRADPLVPIRLDPLLGAQHGDGPMADVVVQFGDGPVDDPFGFVPRGTLSENRFAHATDEQGPPNRLVALVEQQITMKLAVAPRKLVKHQTQHRTSLFDIRKGGRPAGQRVERGGQPISGRAERRLARVLDLARRFDQREQRVEIAQKPRVGLARGKVQVAQGFLQDRRLVGHRSLVGHESAFPRELPTS